MHLSTAVKNIFMFVLPLLLWCFLYQGFLWGHLYVSEDTFAVYAVVKYFLTNLTSGVFAHWNPLIHWGMGHVCQIGEFNPIWFFTLVLNALRLDFYHAFLWTVVGYYFISAWGVYALCRKLFDRHLAYLGFVLYLFSGVGMTIFAQVTLVLIFVPAVWFFVFLIEFYKSRSWPSVLGLSFSLMLIVTTYIPFYFLTVFFVLLILMLFLFPATVKAYLAYIIQFVKTYPIRSALVIFGILAASSASFLNWLYLREDVLALARPSILTYALSKESGIPISEILRDPSIFSMMISLLTSPILKYASEMFDLNNITFDAQRIFYIPILAHTLILGAMGVRINKRMVLWAVLTFILFFTAIARLSPVYEMLYKYVTFFQLFRNIFLLIPFIITAYILLSLEMLQVFLKRSKNQWVAGIVGLIMLAGYGYYVAKGLNGLAVNYVSIGIVAVCFIFYIVRQIINQAWMIAIFALLACVQPIAVLLAHAQKFEQLHFPSSITQGVSVPLSAMQFSYVRPMTHDQSLDPNDVYRLYNWHMIAQTDSPGFFTTQYGYPTRNSFNLYKDIGNAHQFNEYVRHKFVLYDTSGTELDFNKSTDFVLSLVRQNYKTIDEPGAHLEVTAFNANTVTMKTHLAKDQFLVYNDSFHPRFKAYVDGHQAPLHRSNFAFKGLSVPAGTHMIKIQFEPLGGVWVYWLFLGLFYVYFLMVIMSHAWPVRKGRA